MTALTTATITVTDRYHVRLERHPERHGGHRASIISSRDGTTVARSVWLDTQRAAEDWGRQEAAAWERETRAAEARACLRAQAVAESAC